MKKYFFIKNSSKERPRLVSKQDYENSLFGDTFISSLNDIPVRYYHFLTADGFNSQDYSILRSLKNTINYYSAVDNIYNFENLLNNPISIFAFNSIHLDSGIEKKSVELNMYLSGSLISRITDHRGDGVLYSGSLTKVGFILYNEGFIVLSNNDSITNDNITYHNKYDGQFFDSPSWTNAFLSSSDSIYSDISYNTKNSISTNITFVYAEKNKYNHSNNPTYIESGSYTVATGSTYFYENEQIKIKKTNKSPFLSGSAPFEKQTFITRIGMFDEEKKLIAIGNLANPVRKTENREYVFKLKLDI